MEQLTKNQAVATSDRKSGSAGMPRPISTLFPYTTLFRSVRYTQDAFSRSGWLWPVDAKGEPLKATSYMAVGFYVAKYVNKKSDMDLAAKGLGAKEWNNSLKTKLSLLPKKLF